MTIEEALRQTSVQVRSAPKVERDLAHKVFAFWAVKTLRPHRIGEDRYVVQWAELVSGGRHRHPCRQTVALLGGVLQEDARMVVQKELEEVRGRLQS